MASVTGSVAACERLSGMVIPASGPEAEASAHDGATTTCNTTWTSTRRAWRQHSGWRSRDEGRRTPRSRPRARPGAGEHDWRPRGAVGPTPSTTTTPTRTRKTSAGAPGRTSVVMLWSLVALLAWLGTAAAFCPQGCVCNTLRISCENAGLDVVPFQLNPEANTITLRGNNILTLEYSVNFYQQLQQLDISQNRLQSLGSKNFDALERLVSLNVSGNEIGAFGKDAFKGLRALRVLDLSDNLVEALDRLMFAEMHDLWELHLRRNRLASVQDGVFDALVNLRVLQLGDNQLLAVPGATLVRLTSLRALGLSGNLIEELRANAFANLRELSVLSLDNNVISEVDAEAFSGLLSLDRLDLADNNVTVVPTAPLMRLRRLSYLDLGGNMFSAIGPVAFHSLAELRALRLNRLVRLTRVDARAFADNKRLESVSMEGNVRLTSLPTRLFHGSPLLARVSVRGSALASLDAAHFPLDRLQTLDVADVPLICNCSLLWLWLLSREQRAHLISANETAATTAPVSSAAATAAPPSSQTESAPAATPLPFTRPEPSALSEAPGQPHPVIVDLDRIRCAGPADLKGFALVDVPEADVRCEASWMAVVMVTVVVLALFAATCTVLFFLGSGRWCGHEKDASDVSTDSFATQHSTLHKHGMAGLNGLGTMSLGPPSHPHPALPGGLPAGQVMMLPSDMKVEPTYATIGLPGLPAGNGLGRQAYDDYKKESVNVNAYQRALNNWDSSFNGNGTHHHTLTVGRHHGDQIRHGGSGTLGKAGSKGAITPNGGHGPGSYGTYHNHNHYSMAIDMTKKPPHIVYV